MRFVLASPDTPAEALLSSRGNFLASALSRFEEAYLFSNEGDEGLRQISTLANYFVFPTNSRNHGIIRQCRNLPQHLVAPVAEQVSFLQPPLPAPPDSPTHQL